MLRKDGGNPFEQKWVLHRVKMLAHNLYKLLLGILIQAHNKYESSEFSKEITRESETIKQEQQNRNRLMNNKAKLNRNYEEKVAICGSNCSENLRVANIKHRCRQSIFATQVVQRCVIATQKKEDTLGLWGID